MRALWENAEVKKASAYKIWMFVHSLWTWIRIISRM